MLDPGKAGKHIAHFALAQHHGQAPRATGANDAIEPWQFDVQHLLVEKQDCRQGLGLRGSSHIAFLRQVTEPGLEFRRTLCAAWRLP